MFGFPLDHMHKGYSEKVMAPKISNVSSNDTNKQQSLPNFFSYISNSFSVSLFFSSKNILLGKISLKRLFE